MNQRQQNPANDLPQPSSALCSDEHLRTEISQRLKQVEDIDCSQVSVEVQGGKVILEGSVRDAYARQLIEDLADAAPGAQDVENRVRVAGSAARR